MITEASVNPPGLRITGLLTSPGSGKMEVSCAMVQAGTPIEPVFSPVLLLGSSITLISPSLQFFI